MAAEGAQKLLQACKNITKDEGVLNLNVIPTICLFIEGCSWMFMFVTILNIAICYYLLAKHKFLDSIYNLFCSNNFFNEVQLLQAQHITIL